MTTSSNVWHSAVVLFVLWLLMVNSKTFNLRVSLLSWSLKSKQQRKQSTHRFDTCKPPRTPGRISAWGTSCRISLRASPGDTCTCPSPDHTWRRCDKDTCSRSSGPSGPGDTTRSSSGLRSRDDTCTCPGPHTRRDHIRAWDKIMGNCSNLAESLCDIQLPSTYYITDVDLMQIWVEILILSNSDSGTKHQGWQKYFVV